MTFNDGVQHNIRIVFAKPEREQAAEWEKMIAVTEEAAAACTVGGDGWHSNNKAIAIYKSIAKEAKFFG